MAPQTTGKKLSSHGESPTGGGAVRTVGERIGDWGPSVGPQKLPQHIVMV